MGGSYGARTENHPGRSGGPPIDSFGGGDFPRQTPTSPPQSEQPGRGVMIDPNQADYAPVTGSPGRFYTPDRMMTVGVEYREPPPEDLGPLQQFPGTGEGLYSVQPNTPDTTAAWVAENQPPNFDETGYLAPVAQYINSTQFTPS